MSVAEQRAARTDVARLFELCDGYRDAALVQFANQVALFEDLAKGVSARELAAQRGWEERRTLILLRALVARGVCRVTADGEAFTMVDELAPHLLRSSPRYVGDVLEHSRLQWQLWGTLEEVMAAHAPHPLQQDVRLREDRHARAVFDRAMQQLAGGLIGDVVRHSAFDDAARVIDLAGGHGDYLVAVARNRPHLRGEVWDLEGSAPHATAAFARAGLADRLSFTALDVLRALGPPRRDADVVMVNDCLHYFDHDGVRCVLQLAATAAAPNGVVSVVTPWLEASGTEPAGAALFSFYMMVNAYRGGVHTVAAIVKELGEAGFQEIEVARVGELEDSAHIVARRRAKGA